MAANALSSTDAKPPRFLILLLAAMAALSPLSIDMYLPGLPMLIDEFGASITAGQTTLSLFLVGLAAGQLVYGPLSDRYGRRPLLFAGLAVYALASAGCAIASSMDAFIVGRFVQALGGCAGIVVSRAVVADLFKGADAAKALSLLMIIMGAAPILAPIAGALMLETGGWRTIFWAQALFSAATFAAAVAWLPETRSEAIAARARSESTARGYFALLQDGRFTGFALTAGFANGCLLAYVSAAPELFYSWFALDARTAGLLFGLTGAVIIGFNQVNRLLLNHHAPRTLLNLSVGWGAVMAAPLLAAAWTGFGGLPVWMACVLLCVLPFGLVQSNAAAGAFAAQPLRIGSASAVLGAGGYGLGALSGWLLSSLHDGTPRPVAGVMALCLAASAAALIWTRHLQNSSETSATLRGDNV